MYAAVIRLGVAAALLVATGPAFGQAYIQQGHLLDASNRLGSGGLNLGVRKYDFGAGNRLISGNVTAGRSFRGFSPIRDPSSLFLSQPMGAPTGEGGFSASSLTGVSSLSGVPTSAIQGVPTDRFSDFRRDSVGVTDWARLRERGFLISQPRPYYSPGSTVTNVGAIGAGLNRPGTSQVRSPYMVPRGEFQPQPTDPLRRDDSQSSGTLLNVQSRLMRIDTGKPISGPVNTRLLNSSLFGGVRAIPVNVLAAQAERDASLGAQTGMPVPVDLRAGSAEPIDMRVDLAAPERRLLSQGDSPLDRLFGGAGEGAPAPGLEPGDVTWSLPGGQPGKPIGPITEAADVFAHMRAAGSQLVRPLKPAIGTKGVPTPGESQETAAIKDQLATADRAIAGPLKTFVGTEESALNKYLADAEAELKAGQFYEAASAYDMARALDLRNPLPLLGRSMALLAAGDYITSVNNLIQAVQLFESLGHFRIELPAFIPDLAVLDRRRADLERRLETFADFRLRFLLGYAEYCSGMEELGLSNLAKGAEAAPEQLTSVRRFVETLKRRSLGPPEPEQRVPGK